MHSINPWKSGFACILALQGMLGCKSTSIRDEYQLSQMSLVDRRASVALKESHQVTSPYLAPIDQSPPLKALFHNADRMEYWDVSLQEVVQLALSNSNILRDLGGRLVSQPNQAVATSNPDLVRTDARSGMDAALAAFDGQWKSVNNFTATQNGLRNPIVGSSIDEIHQQRGLSSLGVSKISRNGTRYSVTQGSIYDADNVGVPPSRFKSAFDSFLNVEGRYPFGRGGGRAYNAIAGPNSQFGTYNGFWIASIRTDIAEDELQISLRDFLFNVQRNYWLLRFAYDNAQSRKKALEIAQELLNIAEERFAEGTVDATTVLQTKEKYFAALQAYDSALEAPPERVISGILGPNGALVSGSALSLKSLERRLRLLIGIPGGQGGLLRPCENPMHGPIHCDYNESLQMALTNRPELRRQKRVIEQRRLEWLAARNLRLPSIDVVGQYRVHGFGQQLFGNTSIRQNSAVGELLNGTLQDFTVGVEVLRPAGNRLAITAERNGMTSLAREANILSQQQLEISYEVESGLAEVERSQKLLQSSEARLEIAQNIHQSLQEKFDSGISIPIENILDANRAVVELELGVAIAAADYSISLLSLAVARGTLLNELSVNCEDDPTFIPTTAEPMIPPSLESDLTSQRPLLQPTQSNQTSPSGKPLFQNASTPIPGKFDASQRQSPPVPTMDSAAPIAKVYLGFPKIPQAQNDDRDGKLEIPSSDSERIASPPQPMRNYR